MPACYGSWQAVYGLFRRWQRPGVWPRLVTALQARADAAGLIGWDVSVDSTTARAHQHAAGARQDGGAQAEPPGPEPADHALGRSRGGLTTKVHLACEQGQKPLSVVLTAGQRGRQPAVHHGVGPYSGAPPGWRPAPDSTGSGAGRQGLHFQGQPRLPAPARDQGRHSVKGRPGRRPPRPRITRWPAADLRCRDLQATSRRRVRHQGSQTLSGHGHQIRQNSPSATRPPSRSPQYDGPDRPGYGDRTAQNQRVCTGDIVTENATNA